ncbi:3-polyprenyl-4-hydroxybenzoate decarboxylase [Paucilactobacillus oligofermentans DSM 15707 = LMG 22743]|uniref:Flavin prenyltransferase UbiX n=1 Tax=Paucilactobacillus oligofermentans DSM 15707 = LMG 22743 TaxID=1423778 RepID=A0A0R1RG39_9LACO|nr:UbiX family flavin prenyltransferase [Paucilactobacillus oligofermentans]KRL55984.1 3-polyprenyl-4-hydroxybenzoate decarboxylase [Paucilactobacillus oligofermentans DSM 15707 = LMG 22743]CUS26035.1 Putative 3-octaprenyl 4-hydroxybenzoate carboxylyase [Paucilactobacillus oligofermentans DSM 15707 = LMG 22743]
MKKIVIGITGASGIIYGISLLQALHSNSDVETHLVMSKWAKENLAIESTGYSLKEVKDLADYVYDEQDMGAKIASGSFQHDGMVVVPASMKSLAAIAIGLGDTLIGRAADVTLKENRLLIVVPRESPFNQIHLENMLKLSKMGVEVIPPIPAFYNNPQTINDIVNHNTMKLLDHLHIKNDQSLRWDGMVNAKKLIRQTQQR